MSFPTGPWIKFLGTGGGRYVMTRQIRYSAGFWIGYRKVYVHVDPGPGALIRCHASRPRLDPEKLSAIVVTHRHIDHANDASVMIEAMTRFGTRRRGRLIAPADTFEPASIYFNHVLDFLEVPPTRMQPGVVVDFGGLKLTVALRHRHPVETYGVIFEAGGLRIAYITDTAYFEGLIRAYRGMDVAIINCTLYEPRDGVEHLSLGETFELIMNIRPRMVFLTHFGGSMIRARPWAIFEEWTTQLGVPVIPASDGRFFDLPMVLASTQPMMSDAGSDNMKGK